MSTHKPSCEDRSSYTRVACIGAGFSGIGLGATLKRWHNFDDIRLFERHPDSGGTWWANRYPGIACDIPTGLYSFSFELDPNWGRFLSAGGEIKAYHDRVRDKYCLRDKIAFSTEAYRCEWDDGSSLWTVYLRDRKTGEEYSHKCQILFSAAGQLVVPRKCDIPGSAKFKGRIMHSAEWDSSLDLKDNNVVVLGNGCTAAQIVPSILPEVKHLTQIVRSKHWIVPTINPRYSSWMKWIFRYIPLTMRVHRFLIFFLAERGWPAFQMTKKGMELRQWRRVMAEKYIRKKAPEKYHDLLIPDFEIGCKRRIFDSSGYLKSLNAENITLTNAKPLEIVSEGIKTDKGFIAADVIVLATGFQTSEFFHGMDIFGRNGLSVKEHWSKYPGPTAYNSCAISGFPNFFMLLGPNSATGHTSAIIASENAINYSLRILKPVIAGKAATVELKQEAEDLYTREVQAALEETVFNAGGCQSWYIQGNKWNPTMYPWSQAYMWYRSLFPIWSDWNIEWESQKSVQKKRKAAKLSLSLIAVALSGIVMRNFFPQLPAQLGVSAGSLKSAWERILRIR
ncbi:monooxygenase [Histoplasma capsulatum G186AR]|uniref:Monooxygenase n=1 Tax=Ajellomyces capsulatus TaxID=5037 RepID=A0A8H7YZ16_AJECA|nr:monooxygenase [Histoplasma capsulatum]QSS67562.1 monooxygenase [Histoplasma capsulatum G186AR]